LFWQAGTAHLAHSFMVLQPNKAQSSGVRQPWSSCVQFTISHLLRHADDFFSVHFIHLARMAVFNAYQ
jgi:hypothetical protein